MALARALFSGQTEMSVAIQNKPREITSAKMKKAVNEWFNLYFQREPSEQEDPCQRIPYTIVSKLSKAVFGEYQSDIITKEENATAKWLDVNLSAIDKIRKEAMQWALVGGECLLKPVLQNEAFTFRVIRRSRYKVLARAFNGSLSSIEIEEACTVGNKYYTLVEQRTLDSLGKLVLKNTLYESLNSNERGRRVPLYTLAQYAKLPESFVYSEDIGLGLIHVKTPMENCVDGSEDCISVFEPAVGLIHNININEKQLSDEFELGRMRLTVSADMLIGKTIDRDKNITEHKLRDKIFVGLEDVHSDMGIYAFSPTLRNESYEARKQAYLKECENVIGLKRGILSDVEANERTAKEITSTEGEYSLSIQEFQQMWYDTVRAALELCCKLGGIYHLLIIAQADEVKQLLSMSWGNGVLYDERQAWQDEMEMAAANMLRPELVLAHKYDLPCETDEDLAVIREKYMPALIETSDGL